MGVSTWRERGSWGICAVPCPLINQIRTDMRSLFQLSGKEKQPAAQPSVQSFLWCISMDGAPTKSQVLHLMDTTLRHVLGTLGEDQQPVPGNPEDLCAQEWYTIPGSFLLTKANWGRRLLFSRPRFLHLSGMVPAVSGKLSTQPEW